MASETPAATTSEPASTIPATQKTWRPVRSGEPAKALALADDVPVPSKLKKGEILVKVQAAALNPVYVPVPLSTLGAFNTPRKADSRVMRMEQWVQGARVPAGLRFETRELV